MAATDTQTRYAPESPMGAGRSWAGAALPGLLVLAMCVIYALTRITQFNGDGLAEVAAVIKASGHPAINPRYALYFPLLGLVAGHRPVGDALAYIRLLQAVNILLASIALLLTFRMVSQRTEDRRMAVAVTAAVGFSFAFWERAVDVRYVMFGFMALLFSLAIPATLARHKVPLPVAAALSGLGALLAALCYLGNVAVWPAVLWTLWDGYRPALFWSRLGALAAFGGAVLVGVTVCALLSIQAGIVSGPLSFLHWFTWRNPYPGWSEFNAQTPHRALLGFLCAIQNFYTGLHIQQTLQGRPPWRFVPAQISLALVLLLVLLVPVAWIFRGRYLWRQSPALWTFCAVWFLGAATFDAYQCADDPQFWINVLPPFYVVAFLSLRALFRRDLFVVVPVVLLLGNLCAPFWAWHDPGNLVNVTSATAVGRFLGPNDLVISPIYDWTEYLPVFARRRQVCLLSLANRNGTPQSAEAGLRALIAAARAHGGHVYLTGLSGLGPEDWGWVQSVTRLPPSDILDHVGPVRWTDGRQTLWDYSDGISTAGAAL